MNLRFLRKHLLYKKNNLFFKPILCFTKQHPKETYENHAENEKGIFEIFEEYMREHTRIYEEYPKKYLWYKLIRNREHRGVASDGQPHGAAAGGRRPMSCARVSSNGKLMASQASKLRTYAILLLLLIEWTKIHPKENKWKAFRKFTEYMPTYKGRYKEHP